jgi:biotin transport system substrate-specific component
MISSRSTPVPRTRTREILFVVAGTALMAIGAHVAIPVPWSPVPVTGQTFTLALVVALLGTRAAVASLLLYLVEGAAGLPVFSPVAVGGMLGPSGGYLLAFPLAAFVTGRLFDLGLRRSFLTRAVAIGSGTLVVFACGAAWLAHFVGLTQAIALGVAPFVVGDVLKTLIAAGIVQRLMPRSDPAA